MKTCDCCIIGGGSAGLAAAISCYRQGIKDILIIENDAELGGILNQCIHNGFGLQVFKEECTGPSYAERYVQLLQRANVRVYTDACVTNLTADKVLTIQSRKIGIEQIKAKSIIMANGCSERSRGAISIPGDRCSGIYTAGSAQRYLNIDGYLCGKRIFILGSGDIGLIMARRMTLEGAKVLGVAEIQPYSNGLNRNIVQCLEDFDIPLYLHTTVTKIMGKDRIERIQLAPVDDDLKPILAQAWEEEVDCLLLSIGLIPDVALLNGLPVEIDPHTKSLKVNECNESTLPGLFACGNVLHVHDLVDFVSKEAEFTGEQVARYLKGQIKTSEAKEVIAAENIGYVIPQYLRVENIEKTCKFSFRVKKPMKNCTLRIYRDDLCIKEVRKKVVLPAEMETIQLNKRDLLEKFDHLTFEMREDV